MELPERDPVLAVRSLTKTFPPATRALDEASLDFRRGEIHGVVGENGAGKSTLARILAGIEQPTGGDVLIDGGIVHLRHPIDAQNLGIVMIHQELNLVDELSVADNVFLGRERRRFGLVDRRSSERIARDLLHSLHCDIAPSMRVGALSIAQKQMVEIAKALSYQARVLIMDEPTAVLTRRETDALFRVARHLRQSGVTIVYISHLLPEVLSLCDRVTVMRDGRVATTLDESRVKQTTERELAGLMVGRAMSEHFPKRSLPGEEVVFNVRGLSVPGCVTDVSFELRRGEILGFAGLIGAGRTELGEAIAGLRNRTSGEMLMRGKHVNGGSPRDAVRAGIAYVSEDRKGTGLVLGMGVVENTTLPTLHTFSSLGFIHRRAEVAATKKHIADLRVKVSHPRQLIDTLSGGNQQKVAVAKWLEARPAVLILDEPTRGVDIGAKEEIYQLIHRLAGNGMACIFISSELNELLGMCHRIAVMRNGRLVATMDGGTATEEGLMRSAAGV